MKSKLYNSNKPLCIGLTFIALFLIQVLIGKIGWFISDLFSYDSVDPNHIFAGLSVHHFAQMLISLVIIAILGRLLKADFGFQRGDSRRGIRYFIIFTVIIALITLLYHVIMYICHQLPNYSFPLNNRNVIGTLGFQLLLSGPSEELLYRALPITVIACIFRKKISIKLDITLDILLASVLFTIAHVNWSIIPFSLKFDLFQLFYAFAMGIVLGVVYKESGSIIYPMLMHSTSNVLMVGTGYLFTILS